MQAVEHKKTLCCNESLAGIAVELQAPQHLRVQKAQHGGEHTSDQYGSVVVHVILANLTPNCLPVPTMVTLQELDPECPG